MSTRNIRFYGAEAILMSTHHICFYGESFNYHQIPFLSVPLGCLMLMLSFQIPWKFKDFSSVAKMW